MKQIICLLIASLLILPVWGQEVSGGFKAGLNFSQFDGPSEEGGNGNALESMDVATGFHVGAIINVKFTDLFGLRAEFLYSQKGSDYLFEGPSYLRLYNTNATNNVVISGNRRTSINVTNSYIDLPITAYGKLGRFEFSGGISAGFLVGSRASGELAFLNGQSIGGQPINDVLITIDANYLQDAYQINDFAESTSLSIDNVGVQQPSVVGAYYDTNNVDDNLFNRIDFGLVGGIHFFLNQGLFIGARLNYGLSDVTKTEQDISLQSLQGENVILRDDQDRNISIQASVGFSF